MARQEIDLGTRPTGVGGDTPRSAMVKINAMTLDLYTGRITSSDLAEAGVANVSPNKAVSDANFQPVGTTWAYTGTDSQAVANNWPVHYGGGGQAVWWNITTTGFPTRATQVAVQSYNGANGAMYTRSKHDAGWSVWRKVLISGDFGLGPNGTDFAGNIDVLRSPGTYPPAAGGFAFYRLTGATTGTFEPTNNSFNGGLLHIQAWDINTVAQTLYMGEHQYTRNYTSNGWNAWVKTFTNRNATAGVIGGINSGLMDSADVGTWRIQKLLNGVQIASCWQNPNTVNIPANGTAHTSIQLPISFHDWGKVSSFVSVQPSQSWDFNGVISSYFEAPDKLTYVVKNGPVAQHFGGVRTTCIGLWR